MSYTRCSQCAAANAAIDWSYTECEQLRGEKKIAAGKGPSTELLAEYQRRAAMVTKIQLAARECARRILGEPEFCEVDALATANHKGFFSQLVAWVVEPLTREE